MSPVEGEFLRGKKAMAQVRKQKGIPYQTVTVDVPVKAKKLDLEIAGR